MKKAMTVTLCCALCGISGAAYAQTESYGTLSESTRDKDQTTSVSKDPSATHKFLKSKNLVGADVKDSSGQKLGDIAEIYVNPRSGETLASIDISGNRHALVPVQALTVTKSPGTLQNAEVKLNKSKADFDSGPTISKDEWNKLDKPEFVQGIYSHYNVQPSAMGGSELETGESAVKHKDKELKEHKDTEPDL